MANQASQTPDQTLTLNYIDKIYGTMGRVWDGSTRILLTETVLSLLMISLSAGIISVDEQVEFGGLKFKIALWGILGGGALLIGILFMSLLTMETHAWYLAKEIRRLYKAIGYEEKLLDKPAVNPFDTPNILVSSMSILAIEKRPQRFRFALWFDNVTTAVGVLFLLLILPIGAEVAAGLRLSSSFGWKWWTWLPFAILILINLLSFVTFVFRKS